MLMDPALARRLVVEARTATLSTLTSRGHPFGSLVAVAADSRARPLLLLSGLAEHTKNLEASALASLLFANHAAPDPLAEPRVTLLGTCRRVPESEVDDALTVYLARHPNAEAWASFADFSMFRLEPGEIRLVAGFGKMGWVDVEAYRPDTG